MSDLKSFLANRQSTGTLDSEGEFSVAYDKQLERLQTAISEEVGNFALKIIQGMVASGAQDIRCEIGRVTFSIVATGCRHEPEGLLARFAGGLGERRDGTDDLALGVLGALGNGLREASWQLAGGESVLMGQDGTEVLAESNEDDRTIFQFKLAVTSFFKALRSSIRLRGSLHHLISNRCVYSPVPIKLGMWSVKPKEPGKKFTSSHTAVGSKTVYHNNKPELVNALASYTYLYWGRLDVFGGGGRDTHRAAPVGSPIQCHGTKNENAPPKSAKFYAFFYGKAERDHDDFLQVKLEPESSRLQSTVFLLADTKSQGGLTILVHRGVVVAQTQGDVGSRTVLISGLGDVDLDVSTLSVVHNAKFDAFIKRTRQQNDALMQEVFRRRALLPKGAERSLRRLYGYS